MASRSVSVAQSATTQVYVLDPAGEPTPVGVSGEIWIGGKGLAVGYHRRPETYGRTVRTQQILDCKRSAYLPDPRCGSLAERRAPSSYGTNGSPGEDPGLSMRTR